MNRNLIYSGIIISIAILAISCKNQAPANQMGGPVPVNTYEAKQEEATYFDTYPGNVIALNEVQLRSEVNGFITGIYFKEGQTVRKGQKLYEIERSKYIAAYQQAEANLQIAKANQEKARKDAERYTKLGEQDAIAKQKVDYAITDLQNAKLQVASAQAQLTSAQTSLNHSLITAPFDGTIGISLVRLGAFVTSGQTQLNTISSDDPIAVEFVVNEKEIGRFIQLQQQPSAKNDTTFTILLSEKNTYPYPGKIALIDRAVDPQTGTIKVRLNFPNAEKSLRSGMSCNVRVLNKEAGNPVLVPSKAVVEQMGEYFVYTVRNDTARQQKVILGALVGDKIIVKSGLTGGEQIIVDGIQKLREGSPIQIGIPQPAGAGGQPAGK